MFLRILTFAILALVPMTMPETARADWRLALLDQDRCLTLHRVSSRETSSFCYWRKASGLDKAGYAKANWILRDVTYGKVVAMDRQLLDTLFLIQQWLVLEGRRGDIHIISGYRTPENNKKTKGSAKHSQHMNGKAVDLLVPGTTTRLLAAMSRIIGSGGVGFYIHKRTVHVDTADVRVWSG